MEVDPLRRSRSPCPEDPFSQGAEEVAGPGVAGVNRDIVLQCHVPDGGDLPVGRHLPQVRQVPVLDSQAELGGDLFQGLPCLLRPA